MGGAFEGRLPENALRQLRPGDVLFVQTFNSFPAWVVMYLTKSEISHVASYLGDNRIAHSKPFSGVVIEPIEVLYRSDTRILPCVWPLPDEKRPMVEPIYRDHLGAPYLYFPFSHKKDLIDAVSRIYDLEPAPPILIDERALEPEIFADERTTERHYLDEPLKVKPLR